MGYAILMQWTPSAPIGRTSISDLVLSRVLEHYNITHPLRSTIQFRTFRATFAGPATDASSVAGSPAAAAAATPTATVTSTPTPTPTVTGVTRLLTTVTYSQPIPPVRDVAIPQGARDDVTYLFLEDRDGEPGSSGPPGGSGGNAAVAQSAATRADEGGHGSGIGGSSGNGNGNGNGLDAEGFEIIEPGGGGSAAVDGGAASASTGTRPLPPTRRSKYKILAVRPATSVMPTLHNLLSGFVLGLSKTARAAASTTAQQAAPTPLSGAPLLLTSLSFPPTAHPQPPLSLTIHILPNASAQTIFLEGEWDATAVPSAATHAVLREFLLGCVPEGFKGDTKFMVWEGGGGEGEGEGDGGSEGWTGIEKSRRMTSLLTRCLRESSFV